ncbi:uncharacterized protein LOC106994750 isoform X2 [Macaca mulatta]
MGRWRVSGVKSSPSASTAGKLAIATAGTRTLAASRPFLISPPDSGARTGAGVVCSPLTRIVLRLKELGASFAILLSWMHWKSCSWIPQQRGDLKTRGNTAIPGSSWNPQSLLLPRGGF